MQMVMVSLNYMTEIEIWGIRNETEPSVSSTTVPYAATGTSIMPAVSCTQGQPVRVFKWWKRTEDCTGSR
jgi:hypothetical protein